MRANEHLQQFELNGTSTITRNVGVHVCFVNAHTLKRKKREDDLYFVIFMVESQLLHAL